MNERVIIKLGGSILSPYEDATRKLIEQKIPFDINYAKMLLQELNASGNSFAIVIGGGFLNRWYLRCLAEDGFKNERTIEDFHTIGMAASDINASIFRILAVEIFGEENVYERVIKYEDYNNLKKLQPILTQKRMVIGAGWKTGHSHDVDALMLASLFSVNQVISLKNIDGIYSADPNKFAGATKRKILTWPEYRAIIGNEKTFEPGGNFPIDIVAARLAEKIKIGFTVLNGRDMEAVHEAVATKLTTKGSVIVPE